MSERLETCSSTPHPVHAKQIEATDEEDATAHQVLEASKISTWSERKNWQVVLIACYVTFMVGINSTSITSAAQVINREFNVEDTTIPNSYWPVTSWNGGAAIAPMVVIPLLEHYGVRPGYFGCYVLFTLFIIPQALAQNFATLVVTRFFAGCFAGVLQDIMDGIIADLWPDTHDRSLPVTIYVFALLEGVSFGPVYSGAIVSSLHWRWIFYIQLIICGVSFPFVWVFFDETRAQPEAAVPTHKDNNDNEQQTPPTPSPSITKILYEATKRPTYLLFTEPVVFFFTLLSALSYGVVFISTQSVAQVYSTLYSWPEWKTGLVQTSLCIGIIIGLLAVHLIQNPLYRHLTPESRLYLSIPGTFLGLSAGFFFYAWTSTPTFTWVLPSVGLAFLGCGSMITMQAVMTYITDAYGNYAASASAAVCFGENVVAAFLPLAATRLYTDLGFHWAGSVLGFVAFVLGFAPVVLLSKGPAIRARSRFMVDLHGAGPGV